MHFALWLDVILFCREMAIAYRSRDVSFAWESVGMLNMMSLSWSVRCCTVVSEVVVSLSSQLCHWLQVIPLFSWGLYYNKNISVVGGVATRCVFVCVCVCVSGT